ncbi:MAG: hypothetical protein AAF587_08810 [Bacteroidota bacterium]
MNNEHIERYPKHIKLRFRKMNPHLGLPSEQVLLELFDTRHEELFALYLPYQQFRYGDSLYFVLASNDYLHNGPLPMFLKIEFRASSYEGKSLPLTEALSKTYGNMEMLLAHSFVSDNPLDIFLENDDLERWEALGVKVS